MIALGIAKLLSGDARFTAVAPGGIFPLLLPDTAKLTAATYQVISSVNQYTLDGSLHQVTARIQLDAWAKDYSPCAAVREAIRSVLDEFRGSLPDGTLVLNTWLADERDVYEEQGFLFRASADWKIVFRPQ